MTKTHRNQSLGISPVSYTVTTMLVTKFIMAAEPVRRRRASAMG